MTRTGGTPELRKMLREQGYATAHDRGVQLWIMFAALHDRMRAVALEIEYTEKMPSTPGVVL
jgi:hypothetical protein